MVYYNEYHHNINSAMNHSDKFYYLKRITQILLTLSVFSFLISQPSLAPFLVNSYHYFASNFTIKLFTYTTERNYIFLLCNGILVLIIQTSGLITKITPVKFLSTNYSKGHVEELVDHGEPRSANIVNIKLEVFEEKAEIDCIDNPSQEIEKSENQEEEEEVDEGLSTDELNKKCEEFIKKMKQEIQGFSNMM
ncbi:hypothetical protein PHJA_002445900 [Phtheirospermum japonicum]|uniref:Uncharacterized protein n=1 Tax=Phtheirospermum japonicum TaxID=374723 RepID=A0A830CT13_9LAMI|nr:hypothetical protein PHJA_002445900 [Phtheirospermum japonicum]